MNEQPSKHSDSLIILFPALLTIFVGGGSVWLAHDLFGDPDRLLAYATLLGSAATSITLVWLVSTYIQQHEEFTKRITQSAAQSDTLGRLMRVQTEALLVNLRPVMEQRITDDLLRVLQILYPEIDLALASNIGKMNDSDRYVNVLLSLQDLEDRLKDRTTSGDTLPMIHAQTVVSLFTAITESSSVDTAINSLLFAGTPLSHLVDRFRSAAAATKQAIASEEATPSD